MVRNYGVKQRGGFFPPDEEDEKRYSNKSFIAFVRRRDDAEYGPLLGARDVWKPEEESRLMDLLMDGRPLVGFTGLVYYLKRSRDGIGTKMRKIATRHDGTEIKRLVINRRNRTGMPVTDADRYVAVRSAGSKWGAMADGTDYPAACMGRTPADARDVMEFVVAEATRGRPRGFFPDNSLREMSTEELARKVVRHLCKRANKFYKEYFDWETEYRRWERERGDK